MCVLTNIKHNVLGMVSCGLNNENMELKQRIIRNLEWANKRLKLQGKELDETQLEIIEFCLLHDLQQLTIPVVVKSFYCLDEVHRGKKDVCQRQCEYCRKNNKQ